MIWQIDCYGVFMFRGQKNLLALPEQFGGELSGVHMQKLVFSLRGEL